MGGIMTASSSTVDLSRLPAPVIVDQLDLDTIAGQIVADLQTRLPAFTAIVESDPAMKVVEACAYREQLLRQAFQDAALQLFVAYATGANLDQLAAVFGISRLIITPADASTGAAVVYESDDSLRQRVTLAPEAYSVAGPELAYVAHAKSASGDVADASAVSPAPGEVLVSVLSAVGDGTASDDLVAAVNAIVASPTIRPLGDHVTTASAQIVHYDLTAALTTFSGPDVTIVLAAARAAIDAYLATNRLLGRNHRTAGIEAALVVAGVENVTLASPLADILCDDTQAANAAAITITHAGYAA
ncbi:baseplate J/gp47 family protein [Sphingomonas sp. GC_Shp_6]|uniref:baseplate assembly protein n=2 Tax=unclassified Sphingomonas TaxID=196159 RepID=UPI002269E760|nr:baseplate J/gp47 family protein [Sphingomonas sp. GC_Shp_6]